MEQYIPKSALLVEIERLKDELKASDSAAYTEAYIIGAEHAIKTISDVIDSLEVKEVKLEKHLKADIEDVLFDLNGVAVKGATHYLTVEDVKDIARHFFELGLKAQKGEEV